MCSPARKSVRGDKMQTRVGMKFQHKFWLDESGKKLAICEITKIEGKYLWFATLTRDGSAGMEVRCERILFGRDHYGKRVKK